LAAQHHRAILQSIARRAMLERGLLPEFSAAALAELQPLQPQTQADSPGVRDLTSLLWASIDNDDSRDLDQLTVAETLPGGHVKILVAIADVDALVKQGSAIDEHACHNTTSVYTAGGIFPMLPEKLSTDLTSLNLEEVRLAVVVEMTIAPDGSLQASDLYRASVRNHAKLAYSSVAPWLENGAAVPEAIAAVDGLVDNLRVQDRTAQSMRHLRHAHGALSFETHEARPVFDGDDVRDLETAEPNRAKELIEDFMIAANGVTARYLGQHNFPSIRRVVETPKRWDRIVLLAREHNATLPANPDPVALDAFLLAAKAADPLRFPDLSLSVIKLLGAGEYVAEQPGDVPPGHFGLAVKDYAHSTAPNRRYIVSWKDNALSIDWARLPAAVNDLRLEIEELYREGIGSTKVRYWIAAHDLVSQYVQPNLASGWTSENRVGRDEEDHRAWVTMVHADEFPLSMFYQSLQQKLSPVVEGKLAA
jgi:exoribonuclease-2